MHGVSIDLDTVTKRFGNAVALDRIDLRVEAGEFLALIGPSGCGKTTLLRVVAGLEPADTGSVRIDGAPTDELPPWRRPTPMVWQHHVLFPHLDVAGNVEFGLRMHGVGRRDRRQRSHEQLELLGIGHLARHHVHQLSGGQRQRVGIARALALRPPVLLLDEPLSALDPQTASVLRTELVRLHEELGITFLYVTHSQSEALAMADRVAVLSEGRLEQVAAPSTLFNAPATAFVAGFVGMNNLLPGVVTGHEDERLVVTTALGKVAAQPTPDCPVGAEVTVIIPAHATRVVQVDEEGAGGVRGEVVDIEFVGAREMLQVAVDGIVLHAEMPAGSHLVDYGETVGVRWGPETIRLLGPGTARAAQAVTHTSDLELAR